MRFLNSTNHHAEYPGEVLEQKSRQALVDLVRDDFNGSADFICNEPDSGSDTRFALLGIYLHREIPQAISRHFSS